MKIILDYFEPAGNWYARGEYDTTRRDISQVVLEVKDMFASNVAPGLLGMNDRLATLITIPDENCTYLLPPRNWKFIELGEEENQVREELMKRVSGDKGIDAAAYLFDLIDDLKRRVTEAEQRTNYTEATSRKNSHGAG
jgi:hypothetical protein